MVVKLYIDQHTALVAIMHTLSLGNKITNKQTYLKKIKSYINLFGKGCIDDHESECGDCEEEAQIINAKYYTE